MPKDQRGKMLELECSLLTKVFLFTKTTRCAGVDGFDAAGSRLVYVT